jgi:hypothetical protein
MKRTIALLGLAAVLAIATAVYSEERHVKADLVPIDGSGVTGFVQITQLPKGGSLIHVIAHGLKPGTVYASFYYESRDCSAPADLLKSFTAGSDGNAVADGKIDDDLDEVGSVSVRIGPDYGTLLACATVH